MTRRNKYSSIEGKSVLITGGASGIGLATATRFLEEGARVAIMDLNETALNDAFASNKGLLCIAGDVTNPDNVEKAFRQLDSAYGGIDILIANAGISIRHSILDITFADWKRVVDINLHGVFLSAHAAAKRMMMNKNGVIIMMGSTNGMSAHPYYADYNASKAGVISLARSMALELAPYVRVNAVCPGYVMTPMQMSEYSDEMIQKVNEGIPLKRHAKPEEVASLFAFLSSEEASYITGQHIPIDGGETA